MLCHDGAQQPSETIFVLSPLADPEDTVRTCPTCLALLAMTPLL